jgi:hypothetical protein
MVAASLLLGAEAASAQAQPAAAKPWWERITFSGDLRGRYEGFYQEDRDARHRERFRLRVGMTTDITDGVRFGLRLASGAAEDVASTNQSMTDLLARKPVNIDQVYIAYSPAAVKGLRLGGGKYPFPVTRTQMVWDDDVNWEGTWQEYGGRAGRVSYRLVGVESPLREVTSGDDAFLLAGYGQIGFRAGPHSVDVSVADYGFSQADLIAQGFAEGVVVTQLTNAVTRDALGRVTGFVSDFNLVDVIVRASLVTRDKRYPVTLLVDWVTNTDAATPEDTGVWAFVGLGEAAEARTFSAGYTFARIEQDAVLGGFNFSDMPASNVRMSMVHLSYAPRARVNLDFTGIFTTRLTVAAGVSNHLLKRIQADVRVRF